MMTTNCPKYEIVEETFWPAWEAHTVSVGTPKEIIEAILSMPPERLTVTKVPGMTTLLLTLIEAECRGQKWALVTFTYPDADRISVFELQPRGPAAETRKL